MKHLDKFLQFLQSKQAVVLASIMSLCTQLWHSVQAFIHLEVKGANTWLTYIFAVLFSVSTSFAILLFTVRGRKQWAYFFLGVEVFINVIHYGVIGMSGISILLPTLFMCIIVPVTISVYSSEIDTSVEEVKVDEPEDPGKVFLKQVNDKIGFDITNPKDKSGDMSEEKKAELRKLWKRRDSISRNDMTKEIDKILSSDKGAGLFK